MRQRNPAGPAGLRCGPLMVLAAPVNRGLGSRTGAGRVSRELPTEPGPPRALQPPFLALREKGRFHHGLLGDVVNSVNLLNSVSNSILTVKTSARCARTQPRAPSPLLCTFSKS